jgi:hypothetical protein
MSNFKTLKDRLKENEKGEGKKGSPAFELCKITGIVLGILHRVPH